jgi:dTDP-glucose pyrophosphorylase
VLRDSEAEHALRPSLVILAAGVGSRYGTLKQLEPVGPAGATLIDYAAFDAWRAGFERIVFVIRSELEAALRTSISPRLEERLQVTFVHQRLDALPAGSRAPSGRTRPWGTGHAVLCAEGAVQGPFAVANADDFYGARAFAVISEFLSRDGATDMPAYAVVGYRLRDTLADTAPVSRAVCHYGANGELRDIVEIDGIERQGQDGRFVDAHGGSHIVSGNETVSMNLWGLFPPIFEQLRGCFQRFLECHATSPDAEFRLPEAIRELLQAGAARVQVLAAEDVWCGLTHPQDKPRVVKIIRALTDRGEYPHALWD